MVKVPRPPQLCILPFIMFPTRLKLFRLIPSPSFIFCVQGSRKIPIWKVAIPHPLRMVPFMLQYRCLKTSFEAKVFFKFFSMVSHRSCKEKEVRRSGSVPLRTQSTGNCIQRVFLHEENCSCSFMIYALHQIFIWVVKS